MIGTLLVFAMAFTWLLYESEPIPNALHQDKTIYKLSQGHKENKDIQSEAVL
ncbi:MAG: hypothetical protein Q8M94_22505 [Ignavibacteria bacterium]|nr:hypothetical protein [Ignavibacteria bacterium]